MDGRVRCPESSAEDAGTDRSPASGSGPWTLDTRLLFALDPELWTLDAPMPPTHRFIQLTDLHLSDTPGTVTRQALLWAIDTVNRYGPDFLAVTGDITTYGTAASARRFLDALLRVAVPVRFTPGNAERRSPGAMPVFSDLCDPDRRYILKDNVLFLFPDTSTLDIPEEERRWMDRTVAAHPNAGGCVLITHCPLESIQTESRDWLRRWIAGHRVERLVAGHRHVHRERRIGACQEITTRGLDPDKAAGDLPGLSLFERSETGEWSETFIPWAYPLDLLPADLPHGIPPVGWSIHGDPISAVRETRELGLSCLELRPRDLDFSTAALKDALQELRNQRPLYLSYHLPDFTWNSDGGRIAGQNRLRAHVACALEAGVNSLTVHVPRAPAAQMEDGQGHTPLWKRFLDLYGRLLEGAAAEGVRIAVENLHTPQGMSADDPDRGFGTEIGEHLRWIDAISARLPRATVGALLDVGHARNNGHLGNRQPLCDWYARLGRRILGYHIHQVHTHPQTGKLANHLEIRTLFGLRISFAGFLRAWSTRQIARAPLFIEIRDGGERRRTARRLKWLFDNADRLRRSTDLRGKAIQGPGSRVQSKGDQY